jgi:hypothetical protein
MSERIVRTCDECKREALNGDHPGWFILQNFGAHKDHVFLKADHHFCSLDCIAVWSKKAAAHAPSMIKAGDGLYPRGTFVNDELGLCY